MKKRRFKDRRGKPKEPVFVYGWDFDRVIDEKENEDVESLSWEQIEGIKKFLTKEEKILLELLREGKSCEDISEIMRYYDRGTSRLRINRVIKISKFYCKWKEQVEQLSHDNLRFLFPGHQRVVLLFIRDRLLHTKIAKKTGYTPGSVIELFWKSVRKIQKRGMNELSNFLIEAFALTELRRTKMEDSRMDSWRERLKTGLLAMTGKVWYEWGAQEVILGKEGFADCSGLVIELLKAQNIFKADLQDMTAQGLAKYCGKRTGKKQIGDLAFYGKDKDNINHVMFWIGPVEIGNIEFPNAVIGMCGGKTNMKKEDAKLLGAGLFLKKTQHYRKDFLFFGKVD